MSATAACSQAPATSTVAKFSAGLSATQQAVDAGLTDIGSYERKARIEAAAALYIDPAPGSRSGKVMLPARVPTNADAARRVLLPSFELLSAYAQELASLSGDQAAAPVRKATGALKSALAEGLDALSASKEIAVAPSVVAGGKAGADIVLALIEAAVEQKIARDLAAVVDTADPAVRAVAALLKAVVGADDAHGLRLALITIDADLEQQRRLVLAELRHDRQTSRLQRYVSFREIAASRDLDPSRALLAEIAVAADQMVVAHAALRQPAQLSTQQAVESFVAAVQRLVDSYQRLHALGA